MKKAFVSSRFSVREDSDFLTQILQALNLQDIDAVCYRGGDDDSLTIGEHIKERNRQDIINSSAIILIVSPDYCQSDFCLAEVRAALEARQRYESVIVPIFFRWTRAQCDFALISEVCEPIPRGPIYYMEFDPNKSDKKTSLLLEQQSSVIARDTCTHLGIEFNSETDPAGCIQLVKRVRRDIGIFPPAETSSVDGDLRRLTLRLSDIGHDMRDERERGNWLSSAEQIKKVQKRHADVFSPRSLSFLDCARAAYLLLALRQLTGAELRSSTDMFQSAVEAALEHGQPYTQRDACVLQGNYELEFGNSEKALQWHLKAAKIAELIEQNKINSTASYPVVSELFGSISGWNSLSQNYESANVLFDNVMKRRLALLEIPDIKELENRVNEWREGLTYPDPSHYFIYGLALSFATSLSNVEFANKIYYEIIEKLPVGEQLDLSTWHIYLTIMSNSRLRADVSFQVGNSQIRRCIDWIESRLTVNKALLSPRSVALCLFEISRMRLVVDTAQNAIGALGHALSIYPECVQLRYERAALFLQIDYLGHAKHDFLKITETNFQKERAPVFEPFSGPCEKEEAFLAQAIAYWYLGNKERAELLIELSGADLVFEEFLPKNFGCLKFQKETSWLN